MFDHIKKILKVVKKYTRAKSLFGMRYSWILARSKNLELFRFVQAKEIRIKFTEVESYLLESRSHEKNTYNIVENESQWISCMNNVMKGDNVIVFELFEKRGFSNGGEGCPLLFLKSYLFQRHNLLCQTETKYHSN